MALNKVLLIGNVGNDPAVRTINEKKFASFSIATTERYKDRNGNVKEITEWHSVSVWGKLADVVERFVKRGSLVYVEGKITTRKYTDKEGVERFSTEIRADGLQLLGRKESPSDESPKQEEKKKESPAPKEEFNDDFPF